MTSLTKVGKGSDNLSELIFQKIKNDIFNFALKPGSRFTETELAELYDVSRTPVRQALYRLQQDGFVKVHFRSGWEVKPLDFKEYEELYDLRILLECYAIEKLCHMEHQQLIESLQASVNLWCISSEQYLRDLKTMSIQDEAFHCQLVQAAGNRVMEKVHDEVSEKIRMIRRLDFSKESRIEATYAEHQYILNLILVHDHEQATKAIRHHIQQSKEEVKKITLEMLSRI